MEQKNSEELAKLLENVKIYEKSSPPNISIKRRTDCCTGLIYDKEMKKHKNIWEDHIERPERISRIYEQLKADGLADRCLILDSRQATAEELRLMHSQRHIDEMSTFIGFSNEELSDRGDEFNSIYLSKDVNECALLSAGCVLEALENIMTDKAKNAVAVVRPPGHHACHDYPMGFCYYNNVALAAEAAKCKYNAKRILIVDWDVHYGNGTHLMFDNDPSVLYFSIHRYDNCNFWPCLESANYTSVGIGKGEGYTVHVPWNKKGKTDGDYLAAFDLVLLPIAQEFSPDVVIVSAGFDCGMNDPRGRCKVTPSGFSQMTSKLMNLAEGRLLVVLEGGYNLRTISQSMSACVSTMLGDPCLKAPSSSVSKCGLKSINNTALIHSKYWRGLQWSVVAANCERSSSEEMSPKQAQEQSAKSDEEINAIADVDLIA